MESLLRIGDIKVLLTTAAHVWECQALEWWDVADVIISVQIHGNGVASLKVLRGQDILDVGDVEAKQLGQA